jgi:hypothetical protein
LSQIVAGSPEGRLRRGLQIFSSLWPAEILFSLISSSSGALHGAQAAAARDGAGIAILNGGGDGAGKSTRSAAERFMALREAAAAKASTVFPDAERKERRCPHGC